MTRVSASLHLDVSPALRLCAREAGSAGTEPLVPPQVWAVWDPPEAPGVVEASQDRGQLQQWTSYQAGERFTSCQRHGPDACARMSVLWLVPQMLRQQHLRVSGPRWRRQRSA